MVNSLRKWTVVILIISLLYPILIGGMEGHDRRKQAFYQALRDEHMRCVERDRARRAQKRLLERARRLTEKK